ncbi:interferon alpha/beta receptor 2-like [Chanos chanos]|uniref:Interferon alpha/beta receptor 2-like n=1 Tax=Chanos chanos TaxID=29144 RepID=A0A6J2WDY9_CHACN|nr:interferon alpha/beta receptor 2-like [Chanos chanos]
MEHELTWEPGPGTPASARFRVQIYHFRKKAWVPVQACVNLTMGEWCNLTNSVKDIYLDFATRVQAFSPTQESPWSFSTVFNPLMDTVWGPPELSLSSCGNCLVLGLTPPSSIGLHPYLNRLFFHDFDVQVTRTRDNTQFSLRVSSREYVIDYLEPGVEYCVTATALIYYKHSVPSDPLCAYTSAQPSSKGVIPPPDNVKITSFNMGLVLEWDPAQNFTNDKLTYTAEYL